MINPEIKSRINKVDFELKQVFENVFIKEKYYKTGYFEISANKVCYLKESREYKRLESKVIINQPDLLQDFVKWSYSTNPLNESAIWLDRVSSFEELSTDIINIVEERRLNENYIFNLEPIVDMINEDVTFDEEVEEKTKIDVMSDLLNTFNVSVTSHNVMVVSNESAFSTASDRIIRFNHNSGIKISDMFKIESQINSMEGVNWTVFKEGFIEISWTPSNDEISLK
jgi:hypothetical protein